MARDYYEILGVSKTASQDEIKKAFRKAAHQYHPDKQGGDEAKFKEINEAYQVLGDQQKRSQYDQFGHSAFQQGGFGGGAGGFSWDDFARAQQGGGGMHFDFGDLGDVFGDMFGMGGRGGGSRVVRGDDLGMEIAIDLKEAVFGVKKDVTIQREVVCDHCKGTRGEPDTKINTCGNCHGSGQVVQVQRSFFGNIQTRATCPTCSGSGKIPEKPCKVCHGDGIVRKKETLTVSIPAGIDDRERIRLSGQGDVGRNGGPAGDLYITVRVKKDSRFERDGFTLIAELPVTFSQAALGDKLDFETLDGKVTLGVPAGTQSGEMLRLKGLGVTHLQKSTRGDLLVKVVVRTPERLNKKQRELFEELRREEE